MTGPKANTSPSSSGRRKWLILSLAAFGLLFAVPLFNVTKFLGQRWGFIRPTYIVPMNTQRTLSVLSTDQRTLILGDSDLVMVTRRIGNGHRRLSVTKSGTRCVLDVRYRDDWECEGKCREGSVIISLGPAGAEQPVFIWTPATEAFEGPIGGWTLDFIRLDGLSAAERKRADLEVFWGVGFP